MIVIFAGGVGAAKFLEGLINVVPQEEICIIGNTGDDHEFYGLHVSPDLDILLYTLSGDVNKQQGWGLFKDSYITLSQLKQYGLETWFQIGDKDFATHIYRTQLLKHGKSLSEITKCLAKIMGLNIQLLPMSDDLSPTYIETSMGLMHFEEYFVKHRFQIPVREVIYPNAANTKPAPGVLNAIRQAKLIIFPPSNPIVSIGSILAIPGIKQALHSSQAKKIAISPLINGKTIKGPADLLLQALHFEASSFGVARYYQGLISSLIIDTLDISLQSAIEALGISVIATPTLMSNQAIKIALAHTVLTAGLSNNHI